MAKPDNLRNRVLKPAAERAGLEGIGLHTLRHTCASLLIAEGASMLRLQRWMGHHSAAYTLETYGHLIDGELGNALELNDLGIETGVCSKAETENSRKDDEMPARRPERASAAGSRDARNSKGSSTGIRA